MIPHTSLKELQNWNTASKPQKNICSPFFYIFQPYRLRHSTQPEVHNNYEKIRNAACPWGQLQYSGWLFGLNNAMHTWALQGTGNIKVTQSFHSPRTCRYFLPVSLCPQTSPPRWFSKQNLYFKCPTLACLKDPDILTRGELSYCC